MKTFLRLLCMWHEWRAAVWRFRMGNPKHLSLDKNDNWEWEAWWNGCQIMVDYHDARHEALYRELNPPPVKYGMNEEDLDLRIRRLP